MEGVGVDTKCRTLQKKTVIGPAKEVTTSGLGILGSISSSPSPEHTHVLIVNAFKITVKNYYCSALRLSPPNLLHEVRHICMERPARRNRQQANTYCRPFAMPRFASPPKGNQSFNAAKQVDRSKMSRCCSKMLKQGVAATCEGVAAISCGSGGIHGMEQRRYEAL